MQIRHTLALTAVLSAPFALAQQTASLSDVVVTGASDLLGNFLKASLSVQPGAALSSVNLRQVEQDALATGYLKTASATLQTVNGQNVLVIAVVSNPAIASVSVSGLTFLPADAFKTSLSNVLNIAPGATLNSVRIDQSKQALAQNFRAEGYPFLPSISSEAKARPDGTVDLTYLVDETAPVTRVEVTGSTLLQQATVVAAFKPLFDAKKFTPDSYFGAVKQIQQDYQAAGYLASGVNAAASTLEGGVLKIAVLEGQVVGVDTSALKLPAGSAPVLATKAGGVPSLALLEQDVRALSNLSGQSVGFALQPGDAQSPSRVRVLFGVAEANTGPVKEIRVVGNTLVKTADLQAAISTKTGDVYSRQLAESDFVKLREVYRKAGYEISTRDAVVYADGVLTFNVHETRIAGYQIVWTGPKATQERVITRELPEPGTIYNDRTFRGALESIRGQSLVKINDVTIKAADPAKPENLTYIINVSEISGNRSFQPALTYDTLNGFSGSLGLENNNLFGLGHNLNASLSASPNDAGEVVSANIEYKIPWIDIDFADFRKNRTSAGLSLSSTVSGNNALLDAAGTDSGRDYSVRQTGFGVTVGRQLIPNLIVSASVNTSYNTYTLEKQTKTDVSTTTDEVATALVPPNSLTTLLGVGASYGNTNSAVFPTQGFRANASAAYGFGSSGATPLSWTKLEGGASTYFGLGQTLDKGFGAQQRQQVIAVRVGAGTYIGTPPPGTRFSIGSANAASAYELRGYGVGAFKGSTYLTSSAEYRYDLNVNNSVFQGVYLIGFVDAGTAFSAGEDLKVGYSFGLGTQLNIGLGGVGLPSIRFDYGFSPSTGSSQFHFRLGPVF